MVALMLYLWFKSLRVVEIMWDMGLVFILLLSMMPMQ
jgi:hypothetical protein